VHLQTGAAPLTHQAPLPFTVPVHLLCPQLPQDSPTPHKPPLQKEKIVKRKERLGQKKKLK
jgi:hypothetical protein